MAASRRFVEDHDPRSASAMVAAPLDRDALLRCLGATRQGFLLIDESGRVIAFTKPARDLIKRHHPWVDGTLVRQFLRALLGSAGDAKPELIAHLRTARPGAPHRPFEITLQGQTMEIELRPVPGGGWAVTLEDVSLRRAAEESAAEMARLDPLTRLPNRLFLRERLNQALARLERTAEPFALLLIDLDRFKPVNDTLGHPIGDALLEKVADRLRSTLRPSDSVARIGGDEFVILQTDIADAKATQALARRLVDLLGRTYMVEGQLLSIGASIGIALAPNDASDADHLLKNADLALYRAKVEGRGTFRFFEPSMDARMQARRRLELDMRQALARREFALFYQPQLNLENNRLVGCEALIRWFHPERGLVPPNDFIPIAEDIGLIVPIGEWVIRQACRDAASWPLPLAVAVNVSPAQFKSDRLVETVMSALCYSGLPADRLEVEITEGVLLQENQKTLQTLHQLRDLGVRVSMDDFGTGYSSLSYLRSFPFDKIKIDRSFVQDMARKPDGDAIIRAISGLGKSLGMTTVAEGVETPDQCNASARKDAPTSKDI